MHFVVKRCSKEKQKICEQKCHRGSHCLKNFWAFLDPYQVHIWNSHLSDMYPAHV